MKFAKPTATLITLCLAALPLVAKDGKHHGHGHDNDNTPSASSKGDEDKKNGKADAKFSISVKEREVIQSYVSSFASEGHGKNKHHPLPPGLEKKLERGGQLPPGWEKKVTVGETMPVEVFKQAQPLPKDLVVKLPPPPIGTLTVTIDGKIVRLMEATKTILDVFEVPLPTFSRR